MTEFFMNYGLFALKAITVLVVAGALLALAMGLLGSLVDRASGGSSDRLEVTRLGEENKRHRETLEQAALSPALRKTVAKAKRAEQKQERKSERRARKQGEGPRKSRVFVLDFEGDIRASAVSSLRREITAVLSLATPQDEVVVRLESSGGMVHSYGLAASQLARIRKRGVKLTVAVDKVAASGGYMMACVANHILAAPFAVLGSIGVVAQLPNFHRLLKKHDVDVELFTAGKYKRTITVFGENTETGREKFRSELEDTHELFQRFVSEHRPHVAIGEVATGEVWYGTRALEKGLVDELLTSDDYLSRAAEEKEVLAVSFRHRESLKQKLETSLTAAADRLILRLWDRGTQPPRG